MNNATDNDASEQTGPDARSANSATADFKNQPWYKELRNEFRSEFLDRREKNIHLWFAVIAIVIALAGYIGFERIWDLEQDVKETEDRAKKSVEKAERYAEEAKRLVEEIKSHRDEAKKMAKAIRNMNAQIAAEDPKKANQAVANIRENPEASLIEKAIARAVFLQQQGKKNDAIEKWRALAHVVEGIDNDQAARAWFSVGYLRQDLEARISAYDKAIRLKPDYTASYNNRGTDKHALGRHEAAIADYDEAIRLKPDLAEAYTNRGNAKDALERYEAAIDDHTQAIRLKPSLAGAYYNRGNAKDALGRHEAAITDYDQAIRLKTAYAEAYSNRGNAKDALGRHADAIADYVEAIRLKPGLAEAYYNRGVAKNALGLKNEARKDFKTALELAQNANNAKVVAQAEKALRILGAAEGS